MSVFNGLVQKSNHSFLIVYAYETCTHCDYTTYVEISAKGHKYNVVVTLPTCTEKGYSTYTCSCGESYTADYVVALGHTAGESIKENYIAPTCTTVGGNDIVIYCDICDAELSREYAEISALGHKNGEWREIVAPTCTEAGESRRDCIRCDYYELKTVSAKGHSEVIDFYVAPTCIKSGLTEGMHCSACSKILLAQSTISATGHSYAEWNVTKEPIPPLESKKHLHKNRP